MAAIRVYDRVRETTTTTGTGTITLAGAAAGFQSFSVAGDGATVYYCIENGSQWEVGLGTYTSSGTTLSRTLVFSGSSGSGTLVSFTSGTKNVFMVTPAVMLTNHSCHLTRTAVQSIPNSVATSLAFTSEITDTDSFHSTVTNTARITIPTGLDGYYEGGFTGEWAVNATGIRSARITKNNTTLLTRDVRAAYSSVVCHNIPIPTTYLVAGDFVTVDVVQTSGGALNFAFGADYSPRFWMRFVRP